MDLLNYQIAKCYCTGEWKLDPLTILFLLCISKDIIEEMNISWGYFKEDLTIATIGQPEYC
jgi:hypothetical protein